MWAKSCDGTNESGGGWCAWAVMALVLAALPAGAASTLVFGPQSYTRATGAPVTVTSNLTVTSPVNPYTLHIDNGGAHGEFSRVSSATVTLDGVAVLKPSDFNQNVATLDRQVTLTGHDQLQVRISGSPGSGFSLRISGVSGDTTPPTVAITAPAAGSFVASATPTITATFSDAGSGVDPAGVQLLLDGTDSTAQAQVTASGLSFTPATPLAEGGHTVQVTVKDLAGNPAQASRGFTTDTVAPAIVVVSPSGGRTVDSAPPTLIVDFSDSGSGIDPSTLVVKLDGQSLGAACAPQSGEVTCSVPGLGNGQHLVEAQVRDRAQNVAPVARAFEFIRDQTAPTVAITSPASGVFVQTPTTLIAGTVSDDSGLPATVAINGQPAMVSGSGFSGFASLSEGTNDVTVVATDVAGRQATTTTSVRVDSRPPSLVVDTPSAGQRTNDASVHVTGAATDQNGVARVEVGGAVAPMSQGRFEADVPLHDGGNAISIHAVDNAGNSSDRTVQVVRFSLPTVLINTPTDLSYIAVTTVDVRGTLSAPGLAVSVNGVPAQVTGTSFVVPDLPLIEGGNVITATAIAADGHAATGSINVVRDLTPPRVAIDYPLDGVNVFDDAVRVSGLVNDIVAGTVNAANVVVTVNGRPAMVANRSFVATDVPLQAGDNTILVEAKDASGNVGRASVRVRRDTASLPRVTVISGDRQTAAVGSALPQPLVIALVDAAGLPVPGRTVLFKVVRSDGRLDGGRRQIALVTGPDGRAQAHFTLGTRSGAANQTVEALSAGFQGPAVFTASALSGEPALIVADSGDQQVGTAGQTLPRPLVATVTDVGFNRLEGIPVTFRVAQGRGHFEIGTPEVTVMTDSDGRAIVPFILDPAEGIAGNAVHAVLAGRPSIPMATFFATGLTAGDSAATSISGVVLDNSNQPLPGVTLRILDSPLTALADAQGQFRIVGAPVGTVKLIVDGSTAARPGSWPDLEFVIITVPGRDNTLGMPIYLLPLDLQHGVMVDETRGGTLTLPDIPGFSLEILPGSVAFPGGSRSGVVSVTAVHSDKVPMVPNFGQQPRLIVTIQPAGARFDPPARLTLPNVEGLAPGKVTEFYSFDHDLGHFVSIGPATVSEDGATIVSNPGVGIVKAGWHCGGDPSSSGTPNNCSECYKCVGNNCVPDDGKSCDDHDDCTINDKCGGGTCKGDAVEVRKINGACVGAVSQALSLSADSNAPDKVKWQAPSGTPSSGTGGSFSVTYSSEGSFTVTAMCKASSQTKQVSTGPACSTITPTLHEPEVAGGTGGNWGQVVPGTHKTAKYKGCVDSTKWCFRLEDYSEEHSFGINGGSAIDIGGAGSAAITPATCSLVISDFTPPPVGTPHGPPRTAYWSSAITTAHERFHVGDVHNRITTKVFADLKAFVSDPTRCTDCKSTAPSGTFDAEMNRLFQSYLNIMFPNAEQLAHNHSNAMYSALIAQIRQRARNAPATEGWPAACK
jgi:hypothetical protein